MAVWSANARTGETKLLTFTSKPSGTFNTPFESWKAPANSWARSSIKFVTGDFNGDGREELSVFYKQGTKGLKTYVFGTLPNGGFSAPGLPWWESMAWDWENALPQAGDFDGDGHDDVLVWYAYDDGSDRTSTMLFEKIDGKNKFGSAKVTLDGTKNYDVARLKMVTGDYNGDGRDDLAVMNHQADNSVQMITWTAKADSMFNGGLALDLQPRCLVVRHDQTLQLLQLIQSEAGVPTGGGHPCLVTYRTPQKRGKHCHVRVPFPASNRRGGSVY